MTERYLRACDERTAAEKEVERLDGIILNANKERCKYAND